MASYFGEVLEPISRAIFDEFSDDDEETKSLELNFHWFPSRDVIPTFLETLFVYHGKLSLSFAEAYCIGDNFIPCGEVVVQDRNEEGDEPDDLKSNLLPSRIYLHGNLATCLVSPKHSSEFAFQFANCIAPLLTVAKKVVIFTDETSSSFRTASIRDFPPAFIRELKTSHSTSNYLAEELQVPNIVSGVPAGVASWCQIYKKDASLFVCYTDQQKLDSLTASPYLHIIKKINPKLIQHSNPDLTKKRFYGNVDVIGGSSNIYI